MRHISLIPVACLLVLAAPMAFAADPPMYRMTDIGTLGGSFTLANDMNEFGAVTGQSTPDDVNYTAYIYSHGKMTDLGTLGGVYSDAFGVNDFGTVTGFADLASGDDDAFLYVHGTMQDLGSLGGSFAEGNDVNDLEVVAGDSNLPGDDIYHAFLWSRGKMTDIGTLGGPTSQALSVNIIGRATGTADTPQLTPKYGDHFSHAFIYFNGQMQDIGTEGGYYSEGYRINSLGEVTGTVATTNDEDTGKYHAFVYREGRMKDIGTLAEGENSHGYGINNVGQVTGRSTLTADALGTSLDEFHGFLYEHGTMYDLNSLISDDDPLKPYVTIWAATAINDQGIIVVDGFDTRIGDEHAYLLTPVPRTHRWTPGPWNANGAFGQHSGPTLHDRGARRHRVRAAAVAGKAVE